MLVSLPDRELMVQALLNKDSAYEGIFYCGVKSTGIFCRPTCTAKKPKPENVEFFPSAAEAIMHGYRPCKVCRPMEKIGETPDWLRGLMDEIEENPELRLQNADLKQRGIEPSRVRRWFKANHGMTFQAYLRMKRISNAYGRIKYGEKVVDAALETGYESLSGFAESFKKSTGFSPGESSTGKIIPITRISTPLGPMLAGATEEGICLLEFVDRRMLETQLKRLKRRLKAECLPGTSAHFHDLNMQLKEYFSGKRRTFDLPLHMAGTDFQHKVWKALCEIPYGETRSYKEQAERIGQPSAVRAVARANGDNCLAILIPCHRVIGSSGEMVGYGGGIWRKQYLLGLESGRGNGTKKGMGNRQI